jgi:hypothetical protein
MVIIAESVSIRAPSVVVLVYITPSIVPTEAEDAYSK